MLFFRVGVCFGLGWGFCLSSWTGLGVFRGWFVWMVVSSFFLCPVCLFAGCGGLVRFWSCIFFLSWEWDGVLSGLLRFGVEWLLGLFFLIRSLLRSISARGDLDLVLWSCLGDLVSSFSWGCCYHCHPGPSHLSTCWFCYLVSCSAWGLCSVYCLMFPFCFYFLDGEWGVIVDRSTGFWSCQNRHLEPYMQYPVW